MAPRRETRAETFRKRDYPLTVLTGGFLSLSRELFTIQDQVTRY